MLKGGGWEQQKSHQQISREEGSLKLKLQIKVGLTFPLWSEWIQLGVLGLVVLYQNGMIVKQPSGNILGRNSKCNFQKNLMGFDQTLQYKYTVYRQFIL